MSSKEQEAKARFTNEGTRGRWSFFFFFKRAHKNATEKYHLYISQKQVKQLKIIFKCLILIYG